jgi:hypothetical protein
MTVVRSARVVEGVSDRTADIARDWRWPGTKDLKSLTLLDREAGACVRQVNFEMNGS